MKKCPSCHAVNALDREHCFQCESPFDDLPPVSVHPPVIADNVVKSKEKKPVERSLTLPSIAALFSVFIFLLLQVFQIINTMLFVPYVPFVIGFITLVETRQNHIEEKKGNEPERPLQSFFLLLAGLFFLLVSWGMLSAMLREHSFLELLAGN